MERSHYAVGLPEKGYPQKVDQLRIAIGLRQLCPAGIRTMRNDKFGKVWRIFLNKSFSTMRTL